MKILILGATGYIGSAAVAHLTAEGHKVVALVRPGAEAPEGAVFGDLTDPDSLRAAVTGDIDAVINIAPPTGDEDVDNAAIDAILERLAGTGRAFVYTSGVWVHGETSTEPVDENAPTNAIPIVGYRPRIELRVLDAAARDIRTSVIRPGIAYGKGGGIPALMVGWAREHGAGRFVGEPGVRWPMTHVDDLAALYALAVEKAPAGALYNGVAHTAVSTEALAEACDRAAGGAGVAHAWAEAEAAEVVGGPLAQALGLNQAVSGERARAELGWAPQGPDPLVDVASGSYA